MNLEEAKEYVFWCEQYGYPVPEFKNDEELINWATKQGEEGDYYV